LVAEQVLVADLRYEDGGAWLDLLRTHLPAEVGLHVWPDDGMPAQMDYLLMWRMPQELSPLLANVKLCLTTSAGVDSVRPMLVEHPDIPLVRLVDAGMGNQMVEYAFYVAIHYYRGFDHYRRQQPAGLWHRMLPRARADFHIGILGLGALGGRVADALVAFGFKVSAWSRTPKRRDGVRCHAGPDALPAFLGALDLVIVLIPLTDETHGLLSADRLGHLPPHAAVVNLARGQLLDQAALLEMLDAGRLRGATLDVFDQEPLPADHPLWTHPAVIATPHIAAISLPAPSAEQIGANVKRFRADEPLVGLVEWTRGY
jgi:glyoxylate/hydroxypyruvate reductase A